MKEDEVLCTAAALLTGTFASRLVPIQDTTDPENCRRHGSTGKLLILRYSRRPVEH
jgi:hypothetical protein